MKLSQAIECFIGTSSVVGINPISFVQICTTHIPHKHYKAKYSKAFGHTYAVLYNIQVLRASKFKEDQLPAGGCTMSMWAVHPVVTSSTHTTTVLAGGKPMCESQGRSYGSHQMIKLIPLTIFMSKYLLQPYLYVDISNMAHITVYLWGYTLHILKAHSKAISYC